MRMHRREREYSYWTDIHSHILPLVDNGSVSMQQTKNMLKIAYEDGIRFILATPHYGVGCRNSDQEELKSKLELVRREAEQIDSNFRIELGNELFFSDDIIEHLRKKKALTLAGTRYVLVEFASADSFVNIKSGLHRFLINGYLPVLSHVEKYECLHRNYEGIQSLIRLGAYMQMNISSITGNLSNTDAAFCKKLIQYGMIHLVGTDSHSDYIRTPSMREGILYMRRRFGEKTINQLLFINTKKLLDNQYI